LPKIEIPSHKTRLKKALIDWKYYKKNKEGWFFFGLKKFWVPAGAIAVIFVISVFAINFIFPQDTFAKVKKIALEDPQIRQLISEGATIKNIEITNNKAYVLLTPKEGLTEKKDSVEAKNGKEKLRGALAEIEIKEKRVSKIEEVPPYAAPLSQSEEEKTKRIITESEFSLPKAPEPEGNSLMATREKEEEKNIEIEKIEPLPTYKLKLQKKDGGVEILPEKNENESVRVIYRIDGEKKESQIDLIKERVEKSKILDQEEDIKKESEDR